MNRSACYCSTALLVLCAFGFPRASHTQNPPKLNAEELLMRAHALNGMATADKPWHVLAKFDLSDPRTGLHADSGTFEEWWYAPQSYKTIYKSEKINQTDVLTPAGLYRSGDQPWMEAYSATVTHVLLRPLPQVVDPDAGPLMDLADKVAGIKLRCLSYGVGHPGGYDTMSARTSNFNPLRVPTFCVTPEGVLRRTSIGGIDWFFNDLTLLQGRVLARNISGVINNKPVFTLTVIDAGPLPADAPAPAPDPGSTGPTMGPIELPVSRITLVSGREQFDDAIRGKIPKDTKTPIELKISIDEQGKVYNVQVLSGPEPTASVIAKAEYKKAYHPFLLGDKPIRVDIIDKGTYVQAQPLRVVGRR
jgi:hypothetical protein